MDFLVGKECLMPHAVPALIGMLVDQPRLSKPLPDVLHCCNVVRVSRADKVSIFCANCLHQDFEVAIHAVYIALWVEPIRLSLSSDFIAVFVRTNLEAYLVAILLLIARPDIGQEIVERIANMRLTVDIRNSSGDVGMLFGHRGIIAWGELGCLGLLPLGDINQHIELIRALHQGDGVVLVGHPDG